MEDLSRAIVVGTAHVPKRWHNPRDREQCGPELVNIEFLPL